MEKFLKRVYTAFERNEKKRMISLSRSVPESKNEKIRSGQSLYYIIKR